MSHKYFERAYSDWNILGFLNECEVEPFDQKLSYYISCLKKIANNKEEGYRRKKAQALLDRYKKTSIRTSIVKNAGPLCSRLKADSVLALLEPRRFSEEPKPDYKTARKWEGERINKQIHLHNPTIMNVKNGIGTIGTIETVNELVAGSKKEGSYLQSDDDDFQPAISNTQKRKKNLSLSKKNKESVVPTEADDDKDPVSTGNINGSKKRNRKSSKEEEKSDILEKVEYQDEPAAKKSRQKETNSTKRTYVLKWNLYEDLKQIVVEWTIDDTNISDSFFRFKGYAESKADRRELTFSKHPGEILALNSILLLEENSVRVHLDISSAIRTKIFEQMRAIYPRHDLPKVVEEICRRCARIARKQTREALEEEIDNAYNDLRTNLSSSDKKLLRTSQNVWNHIEFVNKFDSPQTIEDTHIHHSIHPFLRPFFPDGPDRTIDWANKLSFVSASRKTNGDDEGERHKPDFTITVNKRSGKFEIVFGLFKSPYKSSSHFANVDLVDLGVLMKDSLDNMYKEKCLELDMTVFGIHAFGYNVRIYAMDLSYDAVYRMYLIGEFEMPKSNISLCLVENVLQEVGNLKNFVEEYIERLPSYTTNNDNIIKTPTEKMRMIRRTVATPRKVELKLGNV
ncbi:16104_t:CDS:10 [Funneliformis geosporum]|nr:16104_t:CDS:10 [Funneliformis geosporum]